MKFKSLLVIAVLATAVFAFGVNGQTVDTQALIAQLQAQIAQLLEQIRVLQAQQQGTTAWCHTFNTNMGYGATGADFDALITVLDKESIMEPIASNRPSQYNENIGAGVVKLQEKYASEILTPNGLPNGTGYVGPSTRAKLNALYGCRTSRPSITASPTFGVLTGVSPTLWVDFVVNNYTSNGSEIVDFGDGSRSALGYTTMYNSRHDYHSPGTYTVKLFSGTTVIATTQVTVKSSSQPSIIVTSPNGGEIWKVGETHNITWTSNGLPSGASVGLTLDNSNTGVGTNFATVLASQGSYSWTIPAIVGTSITLGDKLRIIVVYDSNADDHSDNYFSIVAAPAVCNSFVDMNSCIDNTSCYWDQQSDECYSTRQACSDPDGGKNYNVQAHTFGFRTYSSASDPSRDLRIRTGGLDACINSSVLREHYCSDGYYINTEDITCPSGTTCQNGACSATTPSSITVTSPQAGDSFLTDQPVTIQWTGQNIPSTATYTISIFNGPDVGGSYPNITIISGISSTTNTYTWNARPNNGWGLGIKNKTLWDRIVGLFIGDANAAAGSDKYYIKVCEYNSSGINSGVCANTGIFTITSTNFVLDFPNGGETFTAGQTMNISWRSAGLLRSDIIKVWLLDYSGGNTPSILTLADNLSGQALNYDFKIPSVFITGSKFMIDVEAVRNGTMVARGLSKDYFTISAPVAVQTSQCIKCVDINITDGLITPTDAVYVINRKDKCEGDSGYEAKADITGDGCITDEDARCVITQLGREASCQP